MLVGGWVRDFLLQIPSFDYDLEVYGLRPEVLKSILDGYGEVNVVGEAFTVYKLRIDELTVDVSIPRRESKTGRGHRGFTIVGDPDMSFAEASRRRDFTINSMLYDPLTNEVIDPYGGQEDLGKRILKVTDRKTFAEDSLRVLRAMQLASRLNYTIEKETVRICRDISLSDLPAERIWAEVEKWLLLSLKPSIGFQAAFELGIAEKLWPELYALKGCPQDPEWHPEGDVDIHTSMVIDEARKLIDDLDKPRKLTVMLGALCHDFGKPLTTRPENGRIRSKGHEDAGIQPTDSFLHKLNVNTVGGYHVRNQVKALVASHLAPNHFYKSTLKGDKVSDGAFRRLAGRVDPELLYRVARADCLGRTGDFKPEAEEWFIDKVRALGVVDGPPAKLLLGRHLIDLGVEPGPRMRELIDSVYELQLDGKITSLAEAIAAAKVQIKTT